MKFHPSMLGYPQPIPDPFANRLSVSRIQQAVSDFYGIPLERLLSKSKLSEYARPRQVAMFLARELTKKSLPDIGNLFHRDHTTVLFAIGAVAMRERDDPNVAHALRVLRERLSTALFIPVEMAA
jgi:chromosomal replication initiator protein